MNPLTEEIIKQMVVNTAMNVSEIDKYISMQIKFNKKLLNKQKIIGCGLVLFSLYTISEINKLNKQIRFLRGEV